MKETVGVAFLTNGQRRGYLEQNINAFLANCSYRPLVISIFDNGSTDDTPEYCRYRLPVMQDVGFRYVRSEKDLGCGAGVNRAIQLVKEFQFHLFLECDWTCLHESESGCSPDWMDECLDFMKTGKCDYLYLRRFRNDAEAAFHHWPFVMANSGHTDGKFLHTEKFMFSNNPSLRRTQKLFDCGTLPLQEFFNAQGEGTEKKGNAEWGQAEHMAKMPPNFYIHKWGMFVHESTPTPIGQLKPVGCEKYGDGKGVSTCKYGFTEFRHDWCPLCDFNKEHHDLLAHQQRYNWYYETMLQMRRKIMPTVDKMEYNPGLSRMMEQFSSATSKVNHIEERRKVLEKEQKETIK